MGDSGDTIFALSTSHARSAIAVTRLSGPGAGNILTCLAGRLPSPRHAALVTLGSEEDTIDRAIVLWFPSPNSFTGEDVVEFHTHGGPAILRKLMARLGNFAGTRPANPGEFTRRAFENGRLDLTAAEGIADVIQAETEAQHRQALRQVSGVFAAQIDEWKALLTRALAMTEALIDFPDEDIPEDAARRAVEPLVGMQAAIAAHLRDAKRGERIREGISIAIVGPPNSGKSSLLNRLAQRDAVIVSPIAGTTRDVVEIHLQLGGYAVSMADTAGIRETRDIIEEEGVKRAYDMAGQSDLLLILLDSTQPEQLADFLPLLDERALLVWNKTDLCPPQDEAGIAISVLTGDGVDRLVTAVQQRLQETLGGPPALITRARHRSALEKVEATLDRMFHVKHSDSELLAEDLRLALRQLGTITGEVGVEELLDVVFREFCIGK